MDFNKLTYNWLITELKKINFKQNSIFESLTVNDKKKYLMLSVKKQFNVKYHLTIFEDQWNNYVSPSKLNAKLFHITFDVNDEEKKCSTYLILTDKYRVRLVPETDFKYNQPEFGMNASTRSQCIDKAIKLIAKSFEVLIYLIAKMKHI